MSGTRRNSTPLSRNSIHGLEDVAGDHGDVLHAGGEVVIEILLDLALLLAFGGFVDGELDAAVAVRHDLGHQRRVLGGDILVVEVQQLAEAHHLVIELDPVIHLAERHVADDVVDGGQAGGLRFLVLDGAIGGGEDALIVVAVHEDVQGLAVGVNGRGAEDAEIILLFARRPGGFAAARGGLLPGLLHVVHFEGDDLDAVAVHHVMRGDVAAGTV